MHELGITRNIVAICREHARGRRVTRVTVSIGKLSAVMPRAVAFCFDIAAAGTPVEGARLEIEEIDGRGRCRSCGDGRAIETLVVRCASPTCDGRIDIIAGEELTIREMETL